MSLVTLTVGAPAHGGHCVARLDGRVIFVRHAIPGEVVEARITRGGERDRFWQADAVKVLEAAPIRVPHIWSDGGPGGVGGADLGHVSLAGQQEWKLAVIEDSWQKFAGRAYGGVVEQLPGDLERGGLRWRTRIQATIAESGRPAMHPVSSRRAQEISSMPLATEAAEKALFDGRFPHGSRVGVVNPAGTDEAFATVNGMLWRKGEPDRRPNARSTVTEKVAVAGKEYAYKVALNGFWQVHRDAPAVLIEAVQGMIGDGERVADLYAGVGLFTVPLGEQGREVLSIESDDTASAHARRNAYHLPQVDIVAGDVRETLRETKPRLDGVVLDPPRSGAGKATLEAIADTEANWLVYVACDPVALARDISLLHELGYDLDHARAFDLFPMTHHMEMVARFTRR